MRLVALLCLQIGVDHRQVCTANIEMKQAIWPQVVRWTAVTALAHLTWELLQLPLFTVWDPGNALPALRAAAHCTGGDLLISLAVAGIVGLVFRDPLWPVHAPGRRHLFALVLGVAYAVFSEWRNVYVVANWAYSDSMPRWFGIGMAPLLQWILVPPVTWWWLRRAISDDAADHQPGSTARHD